MTKAEIELLAHKVKSGEASKEEADVLLDEISKLLDEVIEEAK
jgi:hypothetical protein